jgi:hypothetical protein
VDAENDENWIWFVGLLREVIEVYASTLLAPQTLISISDLQKGLLDGVQLSFPNSPHGYRLRHLYENMYKDPKFKEFLFKAARAIIEKDFDLELKDIDTLHPRALGWLLNHAHPRHWAEYYFPGRRYFNYWRRYGHITSNITESFNAAIREKPILDMLEPQTPHLRIAMSQCHG